MEVSKVEEFHKAFKLPISEKLKLPDPNERHLRRALLLEEVNEYIEGEINNSLIDIADGLADMVYIICGTALAYGIPLEDVFNEVHRSNMTKLDTDGNPIFREDGKILKGPNYEPPNIGKVLHGLK